jgi:hypothetical protein
MAKTIAELYARLNPDAVRERLGFSSEMNAEWLHRYQPCLFGRMAAKLNLISYCILTENDLTRSDDAIRDKIQAARLMWTREGYEGKKSAFIVLAVSKTIVAAQPDEALMQLALRLCSLYLLREIEPEIIYLDEMFLEKPGNQRVTWKWVAGVNVFSANADRRWWQDHRIPGGLGYSVNSVGHLAKSGKLTQALQEVDRLMDAPSEPLVATKVDSLEKALEFAMRTISGASEAISGKATELLPLPSDRNVLAVSKCPVDLPRFLAEKLLRIPGLL